LHPLIVTPRATGGDVQENDRAFTVGCYWHGIDRVHRALQRVGLCEGVACGEHGCCDRCNNSHFLHLHMQSLFLFVTVPLKLRPRQRGGACLFPSTFSMPVWRWKMQWFRAFFAGWCEWREGSRDIGTSRDRVRALLRALGEVFAGHFGHMSERCMEQCPMSRAGASCTCPLIVLLRQLVFGCVLTEQVPAVFPSTCVVLLRSGGGDVPVPVRWRGGQSLPLAP